MFLLLWNAYTHQLALQNLLCLYQLIAGDVDAEESLSNLNIEELNLEELDKKVVEATEEAKNFVNPTLPPSGLFPIFIFYFIFVFLKDCHEVRYVSIAYYI